MNMKDKIKERLGDKISNWEEKSPRRVYFSIKKEEPKISAIPAI